MFPFGIPGFGGEPSDLPGELYDEVEVYPIDELYNIVDLQGWYDGVTERIHDWQEEKEVESGD